MEKQWKMFVIGVKLQVIKKDETDKIIKQQSKLTFIGIHKSYGNCDSYTFKKKEVLMDKPVYLGFSIIELSNLHRHETYYDKLEPYFGKDNIQLFYMGARASFWVKKKQKKLMTTWKIKRIYLVAVT